MPTEFRAIEAYLRHCQNLNQDDIDKMVLSQITDTNADQKVPQVNIFDGLFGEDKMLNDIKQETDTFNYLQLADSFGLTEDMKLPPVSSFTCVPVDVTDQQVSGEHSPQLYDLDQAHAQDLTFYPETVPAVKHIKQEVPDFPAGCGEYSYGTYNYSQYSPIYEEETMETYLINQVKKDIDTTCTSLEISHDPMSWSIDHTQKWILSTLQQYKKPTMHVCMFYDISGPCLCSMTEADFSARSPDSGSILYSQLEIWKNACTLNQQTVIKQEYNEGSYMVYQDEVMMQPAPSLSPAPSTSSLDSNSTSSTGFISSNSVDFDFMNIKFESEAVSQKPRAPATHHKQTIHLWQFLKELLVNTPVHGNCIKWLDPAKGIFKIEDSSRVARLWGKRKNRPAMNYDKLSRSIRQYYKKGIIKKTENSKRLVYQFCKPYLL